MSVRIETENPDDGITLTIVNDKGEPYVILSQDSGLEPIEMDMLTARRVAMVLTGMTDVWRQNNPTREED